MKNSTFIAIAFAGICLNGLTWAGQTNQSEQMQSENVEDPVHAEQSIEDDASRTKEQADLLTFEEALKACEQSLKFQGCIDEKTGQTTIEEHPIDSMDTDSLPENDSLTKSPIENPEPIEPEKK